MNTKWLAMANPKRCNHTKSLHEQGFISWKQNRTRFELGDIVFLYINGAVRFKTVVEAKVDHREDSHYWIEKAPQQPTYRLRLVKESDGSQLHEKDLEQYGFKGGRSLQHPLKGNKALLEYISNIFD